tara:strand:+ start:9579 stop:10511 length:933 start_codon:yes stop_codon:yes gene_type:complete
MPAKKKTAKKKLPRRRKTTEKAVAEMSEGERVERAMHLETIHLPKSVMTIERDIARGKVKMGRPTDYTPRTVESLLRFVAAGLPLERAAAASGINADTLYDWKKKHPDFSESLAHAESQYANLCHITINEQIVGGDGHLALKTLQSRFSKDYSTSKKVEMQTMSFSSTISPEQLLEMQQQRSALDSTSDYESNVIDVDTKESDQSTTLSPVSGQAEEEGGSPTAGEGSSTAPHPPPNPRTPDSPPFSTAYQKPDVDPVPAASRLYCLQCNKSNAVEKLQILEVRRDDYYDHFARFECFCGHIGESPVLGG